MRRLQIRVVRTGGARRMRLPARALGELFAAGGIGLHFRYVGAHPEPLRSRREYESFAARLRRRLAEELGRAPRAGDPAFLLIGGRWMGEGRQGCDSAMILREDRGCAAVFTQSKRIARIDLPAFQQACAHELGHLLGLSHALGHSVPYPATMAVARRRTIRRKAIREAWRASGLEAPAGSSFLLPLAEGSRNLLRAADDARVLPWGSA